MRTCEMNLLFLFLLLSAADAYKVLVVYPVPIRSLNNLGEGIVRHLLDAGHEVTYVTSFPRNLNNTNLREIDVSDNIKLLQDDNNLNISYILENEGTAVGSDILYLQEMCRELAELTLMNKNVRVLLDDPKEAFDVVVVDFVETEVYAGLAALFHCPLVWSYSMGAHWMVTRLIDDSTNPAYSTDYIDFYTPPFSFSERLHVLWKHIEWRYKKFFITKPKEENDYKKIFSPAFVRRGKPLPVYDDIIYNASLVLSNEHLASGGIPKTSQNWKLVGGFHIQVPPKALPKDLQDIMDNAKHGVVYFSMGSTWKSELIPKKITEGLLKVFSRLDATVIWKYESNLENLPKNVHIVKWAPQQSVLAHPNCKLFISHGGLLSSTEAIHFAVPTIGIPISFDQHMNIAKAVKRGYATTVKLSYNLPNDLKDAIGVMLNEPKYKQKAAELSAIYHDRPVAPGKELVYWIEYAVRTRGATHLRSPAFAVPLYQKAYLDIVAMVFTPILLVLVLKKLCSGSKKSKKEKIN